VLLFEWRNPAVAGHGCDLALSEFVAKNLRTILRLPRRS